ncbi:MULTISPECIES: response regulator transcription factor [Paraburkholderia]|uniref:DNA-binding response OmpR family regulator n=1 Tax=Paraburkholderia tropica TaxID=92647 RepID=A0ABX5MTP6_9BURK|nr:MULTISPECIES: response regulator transcription factor [Paraburkholderia]MBB2979129.1 DNA-binding response OmpR family regulator [Paraburkholderia tropica]MBB2999039.1 DNA-binding response OmpR family regulator [Paraburkholderia tropica]MBB6319061.1 DNA-binding response OmpR family regulator [Paraburkholderia tropica]MDE1138770.1 response regulator transcription factor [Paraburkholderia tropica]OBR51039.1 DNA-binding response regulator [Paraburkholderia tropica]
MRILAIEDDPDILGNIASYLGARNTMVDCALDGVQGYALATRNEYDVIILDLALPRLDGYELCRRLREDAQCETPLIMVTARDTLDERLAGFHAGADDYLVKPFALAELGARVKALSQRPRKRSVARSLQVADLVLDLDTRELARAGRTLRLPPAPMTLLKILMQESPSVVARVRLEEALWLDSPPDSDSLRTHIHQLRQVIDKPFEQALLQTVHGVGYQLRAAQDDAR